jgi:hypothetical protein
MDIYLHIGADKTGTTALQEFFCANLDKLDEAGFHVVRPGISPMGHMLLLQNATNDLWETVAQDLSRLRSEGKCKAVLMSWEGVHFKPQAFFEAIKAKFPEDRFHILYVLREQAELVSSGILQRVKFFDIDKDLLTIETHMDDGHTFPWNARDPEHQLKKLTNVFGRDQVSVFTYDRSKTLDALLDTMGITDRKGYEFPREANPSLTYEAALALQGLCRAYGARADQIAMRDKILAAVPELGGNRKVFTPQSVDKIRDRFKAPNAVVARDWFGRDELFKLKEMARVTPADKQLIARYFAVGLNALQHPDS